MPDPRVLASPVARARPVVMPTLEMPPRGRMSCASWGSVASLIAWLLGPDGGWVTGQVLSPNGGVVLGR
jgi:NAD(P)-dependent dehydrogenase (short-subunit alcohol dehydrogenase family)